MYNPGGVAQNINIHSFSNTTSWSKGGHVIKFGGELRWWRDFNDVIPEGTYGNFTFDGSIAGQGYAEFLLGIPTNSQRIDPLRARLRHAAELGFYVNDTWKITAASRSTTACVGTTSGRPTYDDNLMYNWDPVSGAVIVPQESLNQISPLYPTNLITVKAGQVVPSRKEDQFPAPHRVRLPHYRYVRGARRLRPIHANRWAPFTFVNSAAGPYRIADNYMNLDQAQGGTVRCLHSRIHSRPVWVRSPLRRASPGSPPRPTTASSINST